MTSAKLAVVVLAAGQGTRMKSARPKVLHQVAGRSMLDHVLDAAARLEPARVVVVLGPGMEAAAAAVERRGPAFGSVVQAERLGTGHAVGCARAALAELVEFGAPGELLVLFGDTPLLRSETLRGLCARRREATPPALLGVAFRPADPDRYGRVVLDAEGQVRAIVEYADASEAERRIALCNGGMLLGDARVLFDLVGDLGNDNAKGEYYLTEVFALARARGLSTAVAEVEAEETLGVNSRAELAVAEAVMQTRLRGAAMAAGATLVDPTTVWFCADTRLGRDVVIQPNVFFGPGVEIANGVEIRAFSHIEGARIAAGAVVGPFARLRPGAVIGAGARVGNFVEVKNADLAAGAKANHLSYLGDASIGPGANIGAGTITCNYDGLGKHRTEIGEGAFIGSNTALVAPVSVGAGAIVGAGSTITQDVPAQAVSVARGQQKDSPGAATRLRERQRERQAKSKSAAVDDAEQE